MWNIEMTLHSLFFPLRIDRGIEITRINKIRARKIEKPCFTYHNTWSTQRKSQRFVLKTSNIFSVDMPRGAHEFSRHALSELGRDLSTAVADLHDIDYVIARASSKSSPGCPRGWWVSSDDCRRLENSLLSPPPSPPATSLRNVKAKLVSSEVQNGREGEKVPWTSFPSLPCDSLSRVLAFTAFSMQSPASEMQWRSNRHDLFMVAVGRCRIVVLIKLLCRIDFHGWKDKALSRSYVSSL